MTTSMTVDDSSPPRDEDEDYKHGLESGDHVIRWSVLALWPIQIHGIVLSVGPDLVTLVDFGLSSSYNRRSTKQQQQDTEVKTVEEDDEQQQDEAIMKAWKERQPQGSKRFTIITLTDPKDIKKWNKVNYGESALSVGKLQKLLSWFSRKKVDKDPLKDETSQLENDLNANEELLKDFMTEEKEHTVTNVGNVVDGSLGKDDETDQRAGELTSSASNGESKQLLRGFNGQSEEIPSSCSEESIQETDYSKSSQDTQSSSVADRPLEKRGSFFSSWRRKSSLQSESSLKESFDEESADQQQAKDTASTISNDETRPKLPKSDPTKIVLARVRYILENESRLPPYHLFNANSECIAVWCKTGTFSNLQAAVFLHSTALGQAKSATCLSLFVASQTVTTSVTVPASGIMGWFGVTTTTTAQVGLLSMQPWLIPVLAGYGIVTVGAPYVFLLKAQKTWKQATQSLNNDFWECASPDVYVEAIRSWSGLR